MEPGLTPDPGSIQVPQQTSSGDKVAPYGLSGLVTGQRSQPLQPDPGSIQAPLQHGAGTAFARGVATGGTFGASSFLAAAIDTAAQKLLPQRALDYLQRSQPSDVAAINQDIPFSQRRAQYNAANQATQQQHPYAFGAGEVAGAVAVPAPGAGTAARAAEKAVAAKLGAKAATTAGKVLTKGAGAAAGGAVVGGEFGAGTGLSQGKSAPELAASTLAGAGFGAATGPAAALASKAVTAAVSKAGQTLADKYTQVFGSEVFGHASKKATQKSWAQILGKEAETGVEQDAAKKFVASPEMAPVEAAARKGKLDEAIAEIDKRLEQYRPGRLANYAAVEDANKFEVGKGLDELDTALFRARNASKNPQATQALEKARQEWVQDFSSADSGAVQRALLRPRGLTAPKPAPINTGSHVYRGISGDELDYIARNGKIASDMRYSLSHEGTSYAKDFETAEDYANFGRTNPEKTGNPNYVVEVEKDPRILDNPDRDGYFKARPGNDVEANKITRVWKFLDRNRAIPGKLGPGGWEPTGEAELINDPANGWMHAGSAGTVDETRLADELRAIVDHLPQTGRISRSQFAEAAKTVNASPEAIRYLDKAVLDPKAGLMSWDPKATIPAVELRAQATTRQQSALQAFDKLNPNQSVETKTAVKKAIVGALEKHLDSAAAKSPTARAAVNRIRQDDVRFSVLLAAKQGLQEGLEKQQRQEFAPLKFAAALLRGHGGSGAGLAAGGFAAEQGSEAVKNFDEGNYGKAVLHGGAALGAGAFAGKALGQKLSILANRAQNSQAAQRLYQAIQARLPHGPIGAVTSSNLGQQQPQPQ